MARPASRASSAVAMTLLLTLQLLLLAAPASSFVGPVLNAIARSPFVRQAGTALVKKAVTSGGPSLIAGVFGSAAPSDQDRLGRAAADNAGLVVLNVSVGTTTFSGVVDIFEDFVWVQCPPPEKKKKKKSLPKVPCASPTCLSTLNITAGECPEKTSDCSYIYVYGEEDEGTNTTGYLANATFTAGAGIAGSVVFGCSTESTVPLDGGIGFSKGSLSLLKQLNISRFSYFLAPDDSNSSESTSVVLLGDQAMPQTNHGRSTPLVRGNVYPDLYYVKLTGIEVDGDPLTGIPPEAFDLAEDRNSGGVILSTIDPMTILQADAYYALKQKLTSKIKAQPVNISALQDSIFDLCYNAESVAELTFPRITLVFDGEDSPAMELTTVHYFYKDNETGLQCLTMLPMDSYSSIGSILGSMLQAGTNMIYDVDGGRLMFENSVVAAAPVPSQVPLVAIAASLLLAWVCLF